MRLEQSFDVQAPIVQKLVVAGDATRVESVTDFSITGRLARFGRGGMIEDVSARLLRGFATCLASRLGETEAPAAPSGAEVTAGDAAPEELLAATPEDRADPESTAG